MAKQDNITKQSNPTKLISLQEFKNLPLTELITLLKSEHNITIPKGAAEITIRDLAQNKLHGNHFLFDNEEKKGDKIVQKPVKITKNYEKCPNCLQNKLILQPFPKLSELYGTKTCDNCGNLVKPTKGDE